MNTRMTARDASEVLDRDFLETRGRLLEVAAALDRIDRAPDPSHGHPDRRLAQLRRGIEALLEPGAGRAETIQMLFSLEYSPEWRTTLGVRDGSSS
ncbi:hypothetical protein EP7_001434 [Isosphaeraceae bacterium EP7]